MDKNKIHGFMDQFNLFLITDGTQSSSIGEK